MTRSEYEQRRRALEQQFQADLELLRAAHEVRVRSLDQLWLTLARRIAVETRSEGRTPTRYRKLRGPEGREG